MLKPRLRAQLLELQSKRRTALPAQFTALYRLFLRATSATVLHHGTSMRTLRMLYRPTFEAAAGAVKRLEMLQMLQSAEKVEGEENVVEEAKEEEGSEEGSSERSDKETEGGSKDIENLKGWLKVFDERINNTLSFLLTSSQSRGLSNEVVKRLVFLSQSNYHWTAERLLVSGRTREWEPQLDPKSPEYSTLPPSLYASNVVRSTEKKAKQANFDAKCWGALGEVVQMAEARDALSLGRIRFKLRKFNNKKFY
ncbi:hypothetical protein ACEPAI_8260 [Sanghuangporus weigelae]